MNSFDLIAPTYPIERWSSPRTEWLRGDVEFFGNATRLVKRGEPRVLSLPITKELSQNTPAIREALARLDRFKTFQENWDEEGADSISWDAINHARTIISLIASSSIEPDLLVPGKSGEVVIEYVGGRNRLAQVVIHSSSEKYLVTHDNSSTSTKNPFSLDELFVFIGKGSKGKKNSFWRNLFSKGT